MNDEKDDISAEVDLLETLPLQLSEVEMLSAVFANPGEFSLDDPDSVTELTAFVNGEISADDLQRRMGFTLKLTVADDKTVELVCRLPYDYPMVLPQVFVRSASLSRAQHHALSESLYAHLDSLETGELLVLPLAEWLKSHAEEFLTVPTSPTAGSEDGSGKSARGSKPVMFSRMWIYSHHIYSKIKRRDILEFTHELDLTGFCMPGKPGIIVIEGRGEDVEDFWGRIRRMQWKKLTMKEKQDLAVPPGQDLDGLRKFEGFGEKSFEHRQSKGRGAHADRGLLFQYLDERGFGKMFNMYFNVDGKHSGDMDGD